ncbi:hypothetical protein ACH5RR_036320 [Cinchona calisaya]|uniref:TPX2 C-terminal domain-containing protein n=1 Tax=Cinchona calisaya TaxID=153742 RepID=A0ABD2Y4B4_9GENT
MAGDIQEPFRLSFQADSFHCGSISFGRFETEALCWERRSSFSHNRYLEEVEKCSRPGSVTEKKAYFEAHFRRKALLTQSSSECHSGIDCQSSESENFQNIGCEEDIENLNVRSNVSHVTSYDKSPGHSVHEKEFEMTDHELNYCGTSYSYREGEQAFDSANGEDIISEHVMIEEAHQAGDGNSPVRTTVWESDVKQNHNSDGEVTTSDMSSKTCNLFAGSPTAEKEVCSKQEQGPRPKAKLGSQTELVKSKLTTPQPSVIQAKKIISREASNDLTKKPVKRESGVSLRSRNEKQLSESSASTMHSARKALKPEASPGYQTKLHENKSNLKESTTKKAVSSRPSTAEMVAPRAHQNASRSMRAVSTKQFIKQNGSAFSFKSDERAERRKEFNMKLEEKMHAKVSEMQEVQTKKQEKTEADNKLLRKSLNFKATPMPSFYTEAGQLSYRNKVLANKSKSSKVQNRPSSPAIGANEGSLSFPNVRSGQACYATESNKTTSSIQLSGMTNYPSAVCYESKRQFSSHAASDCHPSTSAVDKRIVGKEEQEKVKHTSLQKQRASEGNKLNKGQKVEGKRKVGAEKLMKGVIGKDLKGVDLRNSSRMSNLAVGVAS